MQVDFWRYSQALKRCRRRTAVEQGGVVGRLPKVITDRLMRASA
jgi:hypothetical protein